MEVKLLVTPLDVDHARELEEIGVSEIVLGSSKYAQLCPGEFSLEDIKKVVSTTNLDVYVRVTRLIHNDLIDDLEKYLDELNEIGIAGVYYSDNAILQLAKVKDYNFKVCYDSETLATNTKMMNFYYEQGVSRIAMAYELNLKEIATIRQNYSGEMQLLVYGAMNMFNSRRKLLSNYLNEHNIKEVDSKDLFIYDENSNEKLPIIEDENGVQIISGQEFNLITDLKSIMSVNPEVLLINGYGKSKEVINFVVKSYMDALANLDDQELAKELEIKINEVSNAKMGLGNYYKNTVYTIE